MSDVLWIHVVGLSDRIPVCLSVRSCKYVFCGDQSCIYASIARYEPIYNTPWKPPLSTHPSYFFKMRGFVKIRRGYSNSINSIYTESDKPMTIYCWASVTDGGSKINHLWLNVSCLLFHVVQILKYRSKSFNFRIHVFYHGIFVEFV